MKALLTSWILLALLEPRVGLGSGPSPVAPSKYGPQATRLFDANTYVRRAKAPDFWALVPYYLPQQTASACSLASVAMVINAARAKKALLASDELVNQSGLLDRVKSEAWRKAVGPNGGGVTLEQLGNYLDQSLRAYGMTPERLEVVHADDVGFSGKSRLHQTLLMNERSGSDFIVVNFLQSLYTGDPEGAVGHIAPLAAYDASKKAALIFDPDRQYYEPYWVGEETLLAGMATEDPVSKKKRGYVYVRVR